jgi:hypothetical protein
MRSRSGRLPRGLAHPGLQERGLGEVVGGFRVLVGYKVAELRGVVLAYGGLEGDRASRDAADAHDLLGVDLHDGPDLLVGRVAVELGGEGALDAVVLVDLLDHVDGDPDRAPLVRDGAGYGLADPPRRVRRELEALAVVELLDGPHQPYVPFLDEVQKGDAAAGVLFGDGDDEPQVRPRQVGLGLAVAALDAFGEVDLLGLGEERGFADLVQVHLDGVAGVARLEVAFEDLLDELGVFVLVVEGVVEELGVDHLDAVFAQQAVDLLDLVGGEVYFLEEVEDLARFQGADSWPASKSSWISSMSLRSRWGCKLSSGVNVETLSLFRA